MNYTGLKWFKCDFHLHTPCSNCFEDKSVTPEDFLTQAARKELDVIAITDHNDYQWIDQIKVLAPTYNITVFPGVEITVGESKIHLLVLFDTDKTASYVNEFLISLGLTSFERESQGNNYHIHKSIFEVIDIANHFSGLVIPAHIDNHCGLRNTEFATLKKLFDSNLILGTQISFSISNSNDHLCSDSYASLDIDENLRNKNAHVINFVNSNFIPKLTFSDNPSSTNPAKHSLDGIGSQFTWIKMKDSPDLKSLRQALKMNNKRIRNYFDSPNSPYQTPSLWLKDITISNTTINNSPINIKFSPQMTTIIGGRGTGKSSVLSIIRNIFEIRSKISTIQTSLESFFSIKKGILTDSSEIEILFSYENINYKVIFKNGIRSFFKEDVHNNFIPENNSEILLKRIQENIEFYSQKEIYEIANNTNSLFTIIDEDIDELKPLKEKINFYEKIFKDSFSELQNIKKIEQNIKEITASISMDQEKLSVINDTSYLKAKSSYESTFEIEKQLVAFSQEISTDNINIPELVTEFKTNNNEINNLLINASNNFNSIISKMNSLKSDIETLRKTFIEEIKNTQWTKDRNKFKEEYDHLTHEIFKIHDKQDLYGAKDRIEQLSNNKAELEKQISNKSDVELKIEHSLNEIEQTRKKIMDTRNNFLLETLNDTSISMKSVPYRDKDSFESMFRTIIKRETEFDTEIKALTNFVFNGNFLENKSKLIKNILSDDPLENYNKKFTKIFSAFTTEDICNLYLLYPNDQMVVKYNGVRIDKLSAGQKTSIILSYLLSRQNKPIFIDQPEDDLDNRLIYQLVVQGSLKNKEKRQLVVVTHNANIPVNGDSEWIIVMDSTNGNITVKTANTIDHEDIVEDVCDIMEGGRTAFRLRDFKYNLT